MNAFQSYLHTFFFSATPTSAWWFSWWAVSPVSTGSIHLEKRLVADAAYRNAALGQ